MDKRDLFFCCRTGNLSRLRYLVEEKDMDLHIKDKWDGTPLYYACLCGHYEVVLYLLQNGVQCDANTFDGERCLYGALTDNIRHLLQNFKVISSAIMRRDKYSEFLRKTFEESDYSDIQFLVENEIILAHRAILSCRSLTLENFLSGVWKDTEFINLSELNMSSSAFKNVMQCLYLGETNVKKKDLKALLAVAKHFNMTNLVTEVKKDLLSKKKVPVLHVQPHPLPQQEFMRLFLSSLPKDLLCEDTSQEPLFVDLHIKVNNYIFLSHKVFICGRCSYLKALVTDHFSEASVSDGSDIQVITLHNIDPHIFVIILQYIYTDTAKLLPENVLEVLSFADIFILPGLKKLCAVAIEENLTTDNIISVTKLIRLYNLPHLEDECAEFMAKHLEEIIDYPDFPNLILEDANEIKNRQEVDTIAVIDDIRYHIDKSEQVSNKHQKHLLINKLLEKLKLNA